MIQTRIIENVGKMLQIASLSKKITNDLKKISRTFGTSEHVTGVIDITYTGVSIDVFDCAIENVIGFHKYNNQFSIKNGLTVRIILD